MELELKARVALMEDIYVSYKKLLEEFFKNSKHVVKEEWEWYRETLVEGRNASKIRLADAMEELKHFRENLNPPYLYENNFK